MKIYLKKISMVMALLTLSATTFANDDLDSRITQLEAQMGQVQTETALGTYGLNTPSTYAAENTYRCSFSFAPLYWHTKVEKTPFAYAIQNTDSPSPIKIKVKEMDFNWDWGFRVCLGYRLSHNQWDIKGEYTCFRTNGNDSIVAGPHEKVIPLKGAPQIVRDSSHPKAHFEFCSTATSDFSVFHRALDLHIGRDYFTTSTLSVRPHLGLKGSSVNQKEISRYSGGNVEQLKKPDSDEVIDERFGLEGNTISIEDRCDFRGLGPMIGLVSKWNLGSGVGIFGGLRGGLLFGSFDVSCEEVYSLNPNNPIYFSQVYRAFLPTTQFHIGLRYDRYFSSGIQHFGIGLGFEEQYFWKQNQILKSFEIDSVLKCQKSIQDVAFYGLTAQLQLDF